MDGILVIDKPPGMTSHDVVQRIRKLLNTSRVGHLGTLDPMATGVLPLSIGKATRLGQFFPSAPKEYTGDIRFGFATSTYDREGELAGPVHPFESSREDVEQAMRALTGAFDQKPPRISAKKIGGEPSYKLARRGIDIESPAVPVEVFRFEMTHFSPPLIGFRVVCSGGTYVRSLAHDLGQRLGCGAHLESLRRLQSGSFTIAAAVPLATVSAADILLIDKLLPELPILTVPEEAETFIRHGNPIASDGSPGLVRIFNKQGEFLAVASIENGWARPKVVLTSTASVQPRKPL